MTADAVTHDLITRFYQCVNVGDFVGFASLLDQDLEFLMTGYSD
jgi:hypothetical protein